MGLDLRRRGCGHVRQLRLKRRAVVAGGAARPAR
jgi:hypothetical protein